MRIILQCYEFKRVLLMDATYIASEIRDFIEAKERDLTTVHSKFGRLRNYDPNRDGGIISGHEITYNTESGEAIYDPERKGQAVF